MNGWDYESECEQLLQRNRGRLMAIARSYPDNDTDDLLQEILLQIWRGIQRFEQRSSIDTWCYRVALNTGISWLRKKGRQKSNLPPETAEMDQLAGTVDGSDPVELLQQFMHTLSPIDRALMLMYLDDQSGQEIADALGISVGAVRVRTHRIKSRLAEWKVGDQ